MCRQAIDFQTVSDRWIQDAAGAYGYRSSTESRWIEPVIVDRVVFRPWRRERALSWQAFVCISAVGNLGGEVREQQESTAVASILRRTLSVRQKSRGSR